MDNVELDNSKKETSPDINQISEDVSSSNKVEDSNNNDSINADNIGLNNHHRKVLQKILIVVLVVSIIALIVIIGDEFSGKNRLNRIFNILQNKIESLINYNEDSKTNPNSLASLSKNTNSNLSPKTNTNLINNSPLDDYSDKSNISDDKSQTKRNSSEALLRDINDYNNLSEEELIAAIDNDFQNECKFCDNKTPVSSEIVKPFVTKIAIDKDYDVLLNKLCQKDYHPKDDSSVFNILNTLPYATEKNSKKSINVLINNGANLMLEQKDGKTLLHSAAQAGNIGFARQLLKLGIPIDKETKDNKTPLYYAIKNNRHGMALFLLNCGAKQDETYKEETKDRHMIRFLEKGEPSWRELEITENDKEWSEAYEYIKQGKLEELKELVKAGKDLLKMTVDGEPAPCIAAYFRQYEIMNYLIHAYDCRNLVDYDTGRNALHFAVRQSDSKMVDLLLRNGFDPNFPDLYYYTPLHQAVYNSNSDCTLLLLHNGADPDSQNLKKQTPLHLAVMAGNNFAIKLFLEEGANMNLQDYQGNTVLHYFSEYSTDKNLLDIIYKHEDKIDFTIKNNEGKTPKDIDNSGSFNNYEKYFKKLNKLRK